jgi:hypothetical protein
LTFTDNPFALDSFVEGLAREAPGLLKEGGYYQMLCEWVEVKGQPWRERLQKWFENSACDVLGLKAYEITPANYVAKRAAEAASLHGEASTQSLLEHVGYFEEHGVDKIVGGLVTIRRSTDRASGKIPSRNWFVFDEMEEVPSAPIGDVLSERFSAEDVLSSDDDSRLLSAKPRISTDVILVQEAVQEQGKWNATAIYLERRSGLPRRLGFNSEIAQLLASWDGTRELDFLISIFARQKNLPKKQVTPDWIRLARRLGALGLITFDRS